MRHEIQEKQLKITDSEINFNLIYEKPYVPQKYINDIKKANILLIPTENSNRYEHPIFPELTLEFLDYVKENTPDDIITDIAISDDDFNRLELHSTAVTVATVIVTSVILPIAIEVISAYLYDKLKQLHRKDNELSAEVNIIVQNGKKSKRISYKGPVKGIKDTLDSTIPHLFENEE